MLNIVTAICLPFFSHYSESQAFPGLYTIPYFRSVQAFLASGVIVLDCSVFGQTSQRERLSFHSLRSLTTLPQSLFGFSKNNPQKVQNSISLSLHEHMLDWVTSRLPKSYRVSPAPAIDKAVKTCCESLHRKSIVLLDSSLSLQ